MHFENLHFSAFLPVSLASFCLVLVFFPSGLVVRLGFFNHFFRSLCIMIVITYWDKLIWRLSGVSIGCESFKSENNTIVKFIKILRKSYIGKAFCLQRFSLSE